LVIVNLTASDLFKLYRQENVKTNEYRNRLYIESRVSKSYLHFWIINSKPDSICLGPVCQCSIATEARLKFDI